MIKSSPQKCICCKQILENQLDVGFIEMSEFCFNCADAQECEEKKHIKGYCCIRCPNCKNYSN